MSPQHWAKTQKNVKPRPGTGETTFHNECKLFWDQGKHTLHIPLSQGIHVATFYQAPGFSKLAAFCAEVDTDNITDDPIASPVQVIPIEDGEEEDDGKVHTEYEKWQGLHIITNDDPSPRVKRQKVKQKVRFNLVLTPKLTCTRPDLFMTPSMMNIPRPKIFNMDIHAPILKGHGPIHVPIEENKK